MMRGTYQALHNIECEKESRKRKAAKHDDLVELLKECRQKFRDYEMDVDGEKTYAHIDFMKRLDKAIGG